MYLRHRSDFNRDFMSFDPFADLDPTNHPDREPEPINCHCCLKVQVKAEGDLCAECFADYIEHIND